MQNSAAKTMTANSPNQDGNLVMSRLATRLYITDMLAELGALAKSAGEEDLYVLLKLVSKAALQQGDGKA